MRAAADALKICMYAAVAGEELRFAPRGRKRQSYRSNGDWLGWALAGTLMLVALSYWIGLHSAKLQNDANAPATVVRLPPEPGPPSAPEIHSALQSQAPQSQALEASGYSPRPERIHVLERREKLGVQVFKPRIGPTDPARSENPEEAKIDNDSADEGTPADTVEGASGKLVRVGRFTTAGEAEKGWHKVLRQYPGMQRLSALPVPIKSLRDGHVYYRLQIGTNSLEHSEVLCNRVQNMHQSCMIIGTDESRIDLAI